MMFKIYICIVSVTAVGKKTRIAAENTSFDVTKYFLKFLPSKSLRTLLKLSPQLKPKK